MLELGSILTIKRPTRRLRRKAEQKSQVDERPLSTAELAECTCPEYCERDHENE